MFECLKNLCPFISCFSRKIEATIELVKINTPKNPLWKNWPLEVAIRSQDEDISEIYISPSISKENLI